jgi:hypothetical protein
MADSRLNLGGYELFPFFPNWATKPKSTGSLLRRTLQYPGTVAELIDLSDQSPLTFEATFFLSTRANIFTLQDFFDDRLGKVNQFWVEHPPAWAILAEDAAIFDEILVCQDNDASISYHGHERLYVRMNNGDITTRHVSSIVHNAGTGYEEYWLTDGLAYAITTTNHYRIGRLLFVRFDQDSLQLKYNTDNKAEVTLKFYELVEEYPEP